MVAKCKAVTLKIADFHLTTGLAGWFRLPSLCRLPNVATANEIPAEARNYRLFSYRPFRAAFYSPSICMEPRKIYLADVFSSLFTAPRFGRVVTGPFLRAHCVARGVANPSLWLQQTPKRIPDLQQHHWQYSCCSKSKYTWTVPLYILAYDFLCINCTKHSELPSGLELLDAFTTLL